MPKPLQKLQLSKSLPTPEIVSTALGEAWGFNFYLPRQLLIMRFPPAFAERYVHQTDRHSTFEPIAYKELPSLIEKEIKDPHERAKALRILEHKDPSDQYYKAWIRAGRY